MKNLIKRLWIRVFGKRTIWTGTLGEREKWERLGLAHPWPEPDEEERRLLEYYHRQIARFNVR